MELHYYGYVEKGLCLAIRPWIEFLVEASMMMMLMTMGEIEVEYLHVNVSNNNHNNFHVGNKIIPQISKRRKRIRKKRRMTMGSWMMTTRTGILEMGKVGSEEVIRIFRSGGSFI